MSSQTDRTVPVYQHDERLREHLTRVTQTCLFSAIVQEEQALFKTGGEKTYVVRTSDTIFYVQGGGQPHDTGYMSSKSEADGAKECRFNVEAVRHGAEGRVLHFGHFENDSSPFEQGEMVEQHIDGERRDLNSRIHTAGHIVSLSMRRLAKSTPELDVTELKAQHYPGASFVEFTGTVDGKFKDAIQAQASDDVSNSLPIKLYWYSPDELTSKGVITIKGMPTVTGHDGKVRVVDIVGAGAYPCGGTHVPDTSFVQSIVIKNIKRQKGISKISYAVEDKKS